MKTDLSKNELNAGSRRMVSLSSPNIAREDGGMLQTIEKKILGSSARTHAKPHNIFLLFSLYRVKGKASMVSTECDLYVLNCMTSKSESLLLLELM